MRAIVRDGKTAYIFFLNNNLKSSSFRQKIKQEHSVPASYKFMAKKFYQLLSLMPTVYGLISNPVL